MFAACLQRRRTPGRATHLPQRCRIATFNLESFGAAGQDRDLFDRRLRHLRVRLLEIDADVLCLQEVNGDRAEGRGPRAFPALKALIDGTPYEHFRGSSTVRPGKGEPADVHNLVTLSRWEIAGARQVYHDYVQRMVWQRPSTGPDDEAEVMVVSWERPILHTRIGVGGRQLDVVNVHFRAPRAAFIPGLKAHGEWRSSAAWAEGLFLSGMKRDGQALEARMLAESILRDRPDALLAVCGDFNAGAREMATRILAAGRQDAEQPSLVGGELTAIDERIAEARRYTVLHAGQHLLPDHILASEALARACKHADVFNDGLDDEADPAEPIVESLHAPLVAEFELPD